MNLIWLLVVLLIVFAIFGGLLVKSFLWFILILALIVLLLGLLSRS